MLRLIEILDCLGQELYSQVTSFEVDRNMSTKGQSVFTDPVADGRS
jgi:hypothetical protein